MIALMMETARTSETLANFCQTTRRYNPEDSHQFLIHFFSTAKRWKEEATKFEYGIFFL
jgi:hypothetical protein